MSRVILILLFLSPTFLFASPKVLILGDSLSAGYGINYEQAWVHLLEEKLKIDRPDTVVVNASISGETVTGALARTPQILQDSKPDLVVIELGGNDGLRGLSPAILEQNLEKLILLAKSDSKVLLVQMRIPLNYGKKYTEMFEQIYRDLADKHEIVLAPFLLNGIAGDPEYMQGDRIHPKVNAQPLIVENILPSVIQALSASSSSEAPQIQKISSD